MRIATTFLHALWETTKKARKPTTTACSLWRGDSFPFLSPPNPTLFMTLTLGLELHPFKASSVGRLGLAALLQMPHTCQPLSIGLTTYSLLRYHQLLSNRPSTVQRPAYPPNCAVRSRISPPKLDWQALQTRWQCTHQRRKQRFKLEV